MRPGTLRASPQASRSGCADGCAARKAGSSSHAASTRSSAGNAASSTPSLLALYSCGTRHTSATVSTSPAAKRPPAAATSLSQTASPRATLSAARPLPSTSMPVGRTADLTCCCTDRFWSGWTPELMTSAICSALARSSCPAVEPSAGGTSGADPPGAAAHTPSKKSMMARDCVNAWRLPPPSTNDNTGTWPAPSLPSRCSAECCSPFTRCTGLVSKGTPWCASATRTRQLQVDRQ
mmetsp:Transcript_15657/g.41965  ORF Transcript_15657/g.41965 Transcript_15657/m.41965 type:complete len:236 (-) Transcript_15657:955-1662(-)